MTNPVGAAAILALLVALTACRQSKQDRLRDGGQRATAHAVVARSAVVQSLAAPRVPGRLIYDKPTDLSYASLHATRPDLDSAKIHGTPKATEQGSRKTNRISERTPQRPRKP
ncbi:MAG TPA: hypothetical protein VFW98_13310 [Gemmatimonadaceae bacterium]|nr:hypothetical protein [Gemmatimonadaceae bacterium]